MKWYFGLNAASANGETGRHARLALISALAVGGLEPHCLYAGERDTFTDWLEARGVRVYLVLPAIRAGHPRPRRSRRLFIGLHGPLASVANLSDRT